MAVVTSITTTPFDPAHLALLQAEAPLAPAPSMVAVTLWDGAAPLCCFGISSPWPGMGFAWCEERDPLIMRAHGRRVGLALARHWRQWVAAGTYRRIESRAPADHAAANALLEWLGFDFVALKPGYGREGQTVCEYVYYPAREG